ncbi:hypothetical protein RJ639_001980 [Escallonia herrerae]|uniref:Uncharacterized protein n=1 Tax=Escallonia herrerae TaxID=1293975 RepID=A0AA88XAZ8_9ASTE|nr:hypothetical protein RJ639_001980 [Escallonia herrerae]
MLFYLTTLNLARFLQEDAPDLGENPDRQTVAAVDAFKHSDFLCKNYILNGLDNALYNVYSPMVNAKALWDSLERKYKTEDAGSKKFVVGKFLDFKMVDSKTVISQVQEFQLILHDIHAEGMVLGESFQVAALIEKLPPTWRDFKNYLKHKRKEMKLEDLIVRLRIEEDNRQSEKKAGNYHQEAKANVVEQHVLPLYPGRLSSRAVSTVAGRINRKDSESNSRIGSSVPVFCHPREEACVVDAFRDGVACVNLQCSLAEGELAACDLAAALLPVVVMALALEVYDNLRALLVACASEAALSCRGESCVIGEVR